MKCIVGLDMFTWAAAPSVCPFFTRMKFPKPSLKKSRFGYIHCWHFRINESKTGAAFCVTVKWIICRFHALQCPRGCDFCLVEDEQLQSLTAVNETVRSGSFGASLVQNWLTEEIPG